MTTPGVPVAGQHTRPRPAAGRRHRGRRRPLETQVPGTVAPENATEYPDHVRHARRRDGRPLA